MRIVIQNATGRRCLYRADIMDEEQPPGIEFAPASEHDHDTEHPVAECRAAVGEALVEQSATIEALDDVADSAEGGPGDENPSFDARIDDADYRALQHLGAQLETVDGSADAETIRAELHATDSDALRAAFAGLDDSDTTDSEGSNE